MFVGWSTDVLKICQHRLHDNVHSKSETRTHASKACITQVTSVKHSQAV
jgi:hypothetical protein